jgi:hypothetical protein
MPRHLHPGMKPNAQHTPTVCQYPSLPASCVVVRTHTARNACQVKPHPHWQPGNRQRSGQPLHIAMCSPSSQQLQQQHQPSNIPLQACAGPWQPSKSGAYQGPGDSSKPPDRNDTMLCSHNPNQLVPGCKHCCSSTDLRRKCQAYVVPRAASSSSR